MTSNSKATTPPLERATKKTPLLTVGQLKIPLLTVGATKNPPPLTGGGEGEGENMEVKDKIININNTLQMPTQMNKRQPAADRQGDDMRHSVSQARNEPAALSAKELAGQIRRNDPGWPAGTENAINTIKESLKDALISIEKNMNRGINLEVENDIGIIIIKIIDRESGELVKQIPLAEAVEISKHLKAQLEETVKKEGGLLVGNFVDKEV